MRTKTKITFYRGLDTIGGVIMEVRYGNSRAFFEAGTVFNPAFDMFKGQVNKRESLISDYIWLDDIPRIDGIYRKEDLMKNRTLKDIVSAEDYQIDHQAFFITHLHLDHNGMMGMISPLVDIYLSRPAQTIEYALEDVDMGVEDIRGRKYLDIDDVTHIGDITVRRFILNDDSYQDYSFYIETPDLKMHHPGDVFVYGKYGDNILKEVEYLKKQNVDILFCEGTRFSSDMDPDACRKNPLTPSFYPKKGMITKQRLDERIKETIRGYDGLIILNYYEREMSDVKDFLSYAKDTGREIVFEPKSAHIINSFYHIPVNIIDMDFDIKDQQIKAQILKENHVVTKEEILKQPDHFIVQNTFENLFELFDYRHTKTLYLHHSGMPLGDYDPNMKKLMQMVELCQMDYSKTYFGEDGYFSPHAENYQILAYIDMVQPKLTVPEHTYNRKAMIANMTTPYFMAEEYVTYVYNSETNRLEEAENE